MLNFFRICLLLLCLINISTAYADSKQLHKNFLAHCNQGGSKPKGKVFIFNAMPSKKEKWVYVLHNISKTPIYINHPAEHPGTASAGWGSQLDVQKWSALMLAQSNFAITCQDSLTNSQQSIVACNKVLKVSRFKPRETNANKADNYWVSENQSLDKLLKILKARGVNWK